MRRFTTLTDRLVGYVIDGLGIFAGAVIAAIAILISLDVAFRSTGFRTLGWTVEMAEYGLLVIGFLGAPWVLRHSDHIRVDVVLRSVSAVWNGRLLVFANTIALITCLFLAWYGLQVTLESYARGSFLHKTIRMPQWIILSIMPTGAALLAYEFAARTVRRLAGHDVPGEGTGGAAL